MDGLAGWIARRPKRPQPPVERQELVDVSCMKVWQNTQRVASEFRSRPRSDAGKVEAGIPKVLPLPRRRLRWEREDRQLEELTDCGLIRTATFAWIVMIRGDGDGEAKPGETYQS